MNLQNKKCVMILDKSLPLGIIANTAAILGITLGKKLPDVVGHDVIDGTGKTHLGVIEFPVPILKSSRDKIRDIRTKLYDPRFSDVIVADFTDLAQGCKTYDVFIEKMKSAREIDLNYFGIALCGPQKQVNKLTGDLPLLR